MNGRRFCSEDVDHGALFFRRERTVGVVYHWSTRDLLDAMWKFSEEVFYAYRVGTNNILSDCFEMEYTWCLARRAIIWVNSCRSTGHTFL